MSQLVVKSDVAVELQVERFGERSDQERFTQARHAFQQAMPADEQKCRVGLAQRSPTKGWSMGGGTSLRLSHPTRAKTPPGVDAFVV